MNNSIENLPDYPALKKLASALWQQGNSYHGAAIMVGSGFSRGAASTGDTNKKLPLWNDFSRALAAELGSSSQDPLRLAEEYCAYFGKQALHDLIKNQINDASWVPGELHKSLLELPWSEVLTTNWDTLLERASAEVHQPIYSVVTKQEELSSARSPRIVKLHGTLDVTNDLTFTQEDYRRYPQNHAAFVNFSRQVFIENELCLLGFSGDDPNFLQWAGWVRDRLENHSRCIYLVGALGLSAARRKYLESINIAPIDLTDLVVDYDDCDARHQEATKIFIQSLHNLKPKQAWEWVPTQLTRITLSDSEITKTNKDANYAASLLEDQLPTLESDRLSYPDWLICPYRQRFQLQGQITDPWPNPKNLSAMTEASKAKLLYEIAWLCRVTFEAIPPWMAQELLNVCDPDKSCELSKKQQLEIALLLLKNTRWMDSSEARHIEQTTRAILKAGKKYWPESNDELAYHNAILARDRFDYLALEQYAEQITCTNAIWNLRRASLLAELGQLEKGEALVAEAYKELLIQYRNDRNSIHVLSRLAWAHWLMRGIDLSSSNKEFKNFPSTYRDSKCDPWDHLEHIRDRISKELDKQQKQYAIEPSFEPGRYKDNANTVSFSNELNPILLFEGVSGTVGMPLRWGGVSFLVEHAGRLAELERIDNVHRFALAIRSANSDTSDALKKVFSRVNIACLPDDDVSFLLDQCRLAINYWVAKQTGESSRFAIDRLRVFIEVLARVSVRATPDQAKQIFNLALSLSKKPSLQHFWLLDAIKRLSKFSLKSIPESQQHDVLLEALSFPLQTEMNAKDHKDWSNPIVRQPGKRKQCKALDRRIDEIIDQLSPCSSQNAPALLRLFPLIEKSFLTGEELNKISEKVWGCEPILQSLPETGLLKYALLELPSPDSSAVKTLVRQYLFEVKGPSLFSVELLADIANAAQVEHIKEFPTAEQAACYFERLVAWRPNKDSNDILGFSQNIEQQTGEMVGKVLARSVVPALPTEVLNKENFQKLLSFSSEVEAPEALAAFPYFAAANDDFIEPMEKMIRLALQSNETNRSAYASYALLIWRDLKESPAIDRLIVRLVYLVGTNRISALAALVWTVNQMYCKKYLSEDNHQALIEALPVIFDSMNYKNISPASREAVSASYVRAACVRLVRDIVNLEKNKNNELNRVLEEAKQDPLPEVRFALNTQD